MNSSMDDNLKAPTSLKHEQEKYPMTSFPTRLQLTGDHSSLESLTLGFAPTTKQVTKTSANLIPPIPIPPSAKMAKLNLSTTSNDHLEPPFALTLNLSTTTPSTSSDQSSPSSTTRHKMTTYQEVSGSFNSNNGDSIISVA